jgi:putative exporter of polyketide antibiotics
VPGTAVDVVPLVVLTLVAAALVAVGVLAFDRRDVPAV